MLQNNKPHRKQDRRIAVFLFFSAYLIHSFYSPDKLRATIFEQQVLPILKSKCIGCHGAKKAEGGLRLDLRRTALAGGDSGRAIIARQASKSLLIQRILSKDADLRMPQKSRPLSKNEINALRRWIDSGANWPDKFAGNDRRLKHWSFQSIRRPRLAALGHPIDVLVDARLKKARLKRSPAASQRVLVRRLYLDLLGLPPTVEQVQAFVENAHPLAYEQLVDQLLSSYHFGERWGRHWLDLARFAETDGYENDKGRPHAFRFRDWVVRKINRDQPFDQFTIEQLAGDLIPNTTAEQQAGTGFHRNTLWNSAASADKEEFRVRAVKDRTNTTGTVWMGLTLGCCQCHSHKYDPIAHREYYRMFAFFNRTDHHDVRTSKGPAQALRVAKRDSYVHRRGNFLDRGQRVIPGTPSFLPALTPRRGQADRLDLARWLFDPRHPLTARVAANRFWQHLFGEGLVPTPENFGSNGEPPTHPRLLNWLAAELIDVNWSRKRLLKTILNSETYRQSSGITVGQRMAYRIDPQNRLVWRQNRFRVEGEIVRDLALSVSGLLVRQQGGPSMVPPFPRGLLSHKLTNENLRRPGGGRYRRGIYVYVQRTMTFPTLAAFDVADGNQACVRRDRSVTPMQALTLLNDPVFTDCTKALAALIRSTESQTSSRIKNAFKLTLSRDPSPAELKIVVTLVQQQAKLGASDELIWYGVARTLINLEEFVTRE